MKYQPRGASEQNSWSNVCPSLKYSKLHWSYIGSVCINNVSLGNLIFTFKHGDVYVNWRKSTNWILKCQKVSWHRKCLKTLTFCTCLAPRTEYIIKFILKFCFDWFIYFFGHHTQGYFICYVGGQPHNAQVRAMSICRLPAKLWLPTSIIPRGNRAVHGDIPGSATDCFHTFLHCSSVTCWV